MEQQETDWEGFESFHEEHCKFHFNNHNPNPPQQPQPLNPDQEEVKLGTLRKKLTFRAKNKRKASFVGQPNPTRKNTSHLHLSTISTAQPNKTLLLERPKRILTFEKPQQGIPIFHHAAQRIPEGITLFRNHPLPTAELRIAQNTVHRQSIGQAKVENGGGSSLESEVKWQSRFQSGNLEQVVRVGSEHHLFMAADTNTRGHRQWFYFTVTAPTARKVKLVIHSFRKRMSLFQIGMRPYGKRAEQGEQAWKPVGNNVRYLKEQRGRRVQASQSDFCLSFDINLEKDVEFCIASCVPYSYSFLKKRMQMLLTPSPSQKVDFKQETLCKTLTGLSVPIITINGAATHSPNHSYIIINARTHPGESSGSWVLDGLLQAIANSPLLQDILCEFAVVLKIVPMLNVEGVCLGNYRTGTMGLDFNRLFLTGSPDLFPQIAALKRELQDCKTKGKVDLFLDLHGHSILPGSFIYGPDPLYAPRSPLTRLTQQMSKSQYFMRANCVQGVDSSKAETSRIYFQVQEGVFSLTCQNSLGMYCKNGQRGREVQMEGKDWQQFGKDVITIILNIYDQQCEDERVDKTHFHEALSFLPTQEEQEFVWDKANTDTGMIVDDLMRLSHFEADQIQLPKEHLTLSQDHAVQERAAQDDSDAESEDLPMQKQQELIKLVRKTLNKQAPPVDQAPSSPFLSLPKESRPVLTRSKGKIINNFKEYRFGVEDQTINDWYTRKRLLSVPKHLKNERQGQSYLIRKKPSIIPNNQLASEPIDFTKRVRTQQQRGSKQMERTSKERADRSSKDFVSRQKALLEGLLMRRG